MRLVSLLIAIGLTSVAHAEEPQRPDAKAHYQAGIAAFSTHDFSAASAHFAAAHQLEPLADLLWSWAQAERFAGNYARAIELYRKYEREAQTASKASAARDMIALCERQLPAPHEPWYTDKLGGAITGSGIVGVTVGVTFLALASSSRSAAKSELDIEEFGAKLDEATLRRRIGAVSLGVGAGLVAAGVLVYIRHDRARRRIEAGTDGRVVFLGARF